MADRLTEVVEAAIEAIRAEADSLSDMPADSVWNVRALGAVGRIGRVLDSLDEYLQGTEA